MQKMKWKQTSSYLSMPFALSSSIQSSSSIRPKSFVCFLILDRTLLIHELVFLISLLLLRILIVVFPADKVERPVSTSIFFLLPSGNVSCLHRIPCAETWHFYMGEPLTVQSHQPLAQSHLF